MRLVEQKCACCDPEIALQKAKRRSMAVHAACWTASGGHDSKVRAPPGMLAANSRNSRRAGSVAHSGRRRCSATRMAALRKCTRGLSGPTTRASIGHVDTANSPRAGDSRSAVNAAQM